MIKQQIAALRKQLDETEMAPSMFGRAPREPVTTVYREPQLPENNGAAGSESYKRDIQNRAKAAVAYGRSFIA